MLQCGPIHSFSKSYLLLFLARAVLLAFNSDFLRDFFPVVLFEFPVKASNIIRAVQYLSALWIFMPSQAPFPSNTLSLIKVPLFQFNLTTSILYKLNLFNMYYGVSILRAIANIPLIDANTHTENPNSVSKYRKYHWCQWNLFYVLILLLCLPLPLY